MEVDINRLRQLPRINSPKISAVVYDIIKEKILSKEFTPGERLDLDTIESQLGVSRTPLKEALSRLEQEGLVQIFPRSGTYVTNPSPQDIAESFEVRRLMEVYAVQQVIEQASDEEIQELQALVDEMGSLVKAPDIRAIYPQYLELDHLFHKRLINLARNRRLSQIHERENLHAQMARIRYRDYERDLNVAQEEHERIMKALHARDAQAAQDEMNAHLIRAKRSLLKDMETTYL